MAFYKTSTIEILGSHSKAGWKQASNKTASFFMESDINFDLEPILDKYADMYRISRDPNDYLLVPLRAVSADRHNENLDTFTSEELLRNDEAFGRRVYQSFTFDPVHVNHAADNPIYSRGIIVDSHYNDINPATDLVKKAVFDSVGKDAKFDEFTEILVCIDQSKDKPLANAIKQGQVDKASMGADVSGTKCSIPECSNIATTTWNMCDHIKSKHSRVPIKCEDGRTRIAHELCLGTIFREISMVDNPADPNAIIQGGLLDIGLAKNSSKEMDEIARFVAKNASTIPESLAGLINQFWNGRY